jgi:hypothetical protein
VEERKRIEKDIYRSNEGRKQKAKNGSSACNAIYKYEPAAMRLSPACPKGPSVIVPHEMPVIQKEGISVSVVRIPNIF